MAGKMINCKTCGNEIAKSAKVCPHCGAKQKKHTIWGVFLVIFGIILISSAIGGNNSENTTVNGDTTSIPVKDDIPQEANPIEISAHDLWMAYDENELNADNQYKGQIISVTGTVSEIGRDLITDVPFIALKAEDSIGIYSIQCFFQSADTHEKVAAVKDGDVITITGKCTGKSLNVLLRDCYIQD